jgi:hypothetical protein
MPVVISQVMSYLGSNWVKTRQQQGDSTFFLVAMEEVDADPTGWAGTQAHTNMEMVGWIAFEEGSGNLGTRDYEAKLTSGVTDVRKPSNVKFAGQYSAAPRFFASINTYIGTDSSELRQSSDPTAQGTTLVIEEEICSDAETNHANEIVGWLAVEAKDNLIHAQSNFNTGCEGIQEVSAAKLHGAKLFDPAVSYSCTGQCASASRSSADFVNADDDYAEWTFTSCAGGHYEIIFGYALGCNAATSACDRPMEVSINGQVVDGFLSMPGTGSYTTFAEAKVSARLNTGTNKIKIAAIGFSGPDINYLAVASLGSNANGQMQTIGEAGTIGTIDYQMTPSQDPEEQWTLVRMQGAYTNPIVIIGVPTAFGPDAVTARVRNIRYGPSDDDDTCDGHCFDIRLQEPSCLDDVHMGERVPWMVIESGTWFSDQGKMIQAGRVLASGSDANPNVGAEATLGGGWKDVLYHSKFPDDNVATLSQVQTTLDPSFVKTRQQPLVGAGYGTGFSVYLEGAADDQRLSATTHSSTHAIEHVGYIAFQHGIGAMGRDLYQAGSTDPQVTDQPFGLSFCAGFTTQPLLFASIGTYNGHDPSVIRLSSDTTATSAHFYVQGPPRDWDPRNSSWDPQKHLPLFYLRLCFVLTVFYGKYDIHFVCILLYLP